MAVFIEIHAIQSVPPSNLNRDDNNSPKSAVFGGVRRHRVSSQSWKKAIRDYFAANHGDTNKGFRTKNVGELLANSIRETNPEISAEEASAQAVKALTELLIIGDKRAAAGETTADALYLISERQIKSLALAILSNPEEKNRKKVFKETLLASNSLDLSLFGRMVASNKELNVEAASQVAHAISTHEVANEFDFFTAVDDFSTADHGGAGMMGDVEFNSSTLYRYAVINVNHLAKQYGDSGEIVEDGLKRFIESFVRSLPSGKQSTFAAQTLPEAVVLVVRDDQPTSLAGAFERPIVASGDGYSIPSIKRLATAIKTVADAYEDGESTQRFATTAIPDISDDLSAVAEIGSLKESVSKAAKLAVSKAGLE